MPRRLLVPWLTLVGLLLFLPQGHAETKVLTAEATYTMGDGESPSFAEAQVLQKAKQAALEQAGTYVEAYSKTHNYELTTEEIQTLAGGVLTVEVLEKHRTLVGEGLQFSIKIKATVTTDKMKELAQRIKGKNVAQEYQKLQAEYAKLSQEVETWKQLAAKAPQGLERNAAVEQIREREQAFADVQQREAGFFQRLVSGQTLVIEALDERAKIDHLIEWIKRNGVLIEIGRIQAFPKGNHQNRMTLTFPVTVRPSPLLATKLSETARSLGGEGLVRVRGAVCRDSRPCYKWVVKIANNRAAEEYFGSRMRELQLEASLEFDDNEVVKDPRFLPPGFTYDDDSFGLSQRQLDDRKFPPPLCAVNQYVFLQTPIDEPINEPINFRLEFTIPSDLVKGLKKVVLTWDDELGTLKKFGLSRLGFCRASSGY